jgi:hypothetical protein
MNLKVKIRMVMTTKRPRTRGKSDFVARTVVACIVALSLFSKQASAENCQLDHVIWIDKKTGNEFVAVRAAQHLVYRCSGDRFVETDDEIEGCGNPRGTLYIDGYVSGRRAYAIYRIGYSVPCCVWESLSAPNKTIEKEVKHWRKRGTAIEIQLQDGNLTIADDVNFKVGGPLGGGNYVPTFCRK